MKTKLLYGRIQDNIVVSALTWYEHEKRVYVHYFFPFLSVEPAAEDLPHDLIVGIERFCENNKLMLVSY